jgi:hypothetical protein
VIEAMARARGAQFAPAATTALAIGLPIAAALPRADVLVRRWTPQSEFERFRAGIRALSDRPTIITLFDVRDGGFVPAADPRDPDAYDLVDLERFAAAPAAAVGSFYYRAANCVSPDAADPSLGRFHLEDGCDAFESRYALSPVWEASLPALPYRGERYTRDPVPIGLYRVVGLAEGSRR